MKTGCQTSESVCCSIIEGIIKSPKMTLHVLTVPRYFQPTSHYTTTHIGSTIICQPNPSMKTDSASYTSKTCGHWWLWQNSTERKKGRKSSDCSHKPTIKIPGIRNCKYSACVGNIVYFINKLKLKGKDFTMINDDEAEQMISSSSNRNAPESMLEKIFGYFFNE